VTTTTLQATHATVVDDGTIRLALAAGDESSLSLPLGAADAMALSLDLLSAARRHCGRAPADSIKGPIND